MSGPLLRSTLRHLRTVAGLYLLVLVVMTHWPRLQVVSGDAPVDKLMHFVGFGFAAAAVFLARWCVRWWLLLPVMFGFTLLDEITQSMFSTGRVYSFADVVAGWMGVVTVVALVQSFRPLGGTPSLRRRTRWLEGAVSLLARPGPWLLICLAGVIGAIAGGYALVSLDGIFPRPHPGRAVLMGALVGGLGLAHWVFEVGHRRELRGIREERRCHGCGFPRGPDAQSSGQVVDCPQCGRSSRTLEWEPCAPLSRSLLIHAAFRPLLVSGLALLLLLALWGGLIGLRDYPAVISFDLWWRQLGYESQGVVDLAVGGLLAALTIDGFRRRVALAVDRQASRCLACGQDLNGVPISCGQGRCPECGVPFSVDQSDVCSAT